MHCWNERKIGNERARSMTLGPELPFSRACLEVVMISSDPLVLSDDEAAIYPLGLRLPFTPLLISTSNSSILTHCYHSFRQTIISAFHYYSIFCLLRVVGPPQAQTFRAECKTERCLPRRQTRSVMCLGHSPQLIRDASRLRLCMVTVQYILKHPPLRRSAERRSLEVYLSWIVQSRHSPHFPRTYLGMTLQT